MAYEYNAESAQSILAQVAFYQATNYVTKGVQIDLTDEGSQSYFLEVYAFLHNALVDAEKRAVAAAPKASTSSGGQRSGGQRRSGGQDNVNSARKAFGGGLEILTDKSDIEGDHPQWLFDEAAARGVGKVFDNRSDEQRERNWPAYQQALDLPRNISREAKAAAYKKDYKDGGPYKFWEPRDDEESF